MAIDLLGPLDLLVRVDVKELEVQLYQSDDVWHAFAINPYGIDIVCGRPGQPQGALDERRFSHAVCPDDGDVDAIHVAGGGRGGERLYDITQDT